MTEAGSGSVSLGFLVSELAHPILSPAPWGPWCLEDRRKQVCFYQPPAAEDCKLGLSHFANLH